MFFQTALFKAATNKCAINEKPRKCTVLPEYSLGSTYEKFVRELVVFYIICSQ